MEPGAIPDMGYGRVWVSRWQQEPQKKARSAV
jgi:hypothetical protein